MSADTVSFDAAPSPAALGCCAGRRLAPSSVPPTALLPGSKSRGGRHVASVLPVLLHVHASTAAEHWIAQRSTWRNQPILHGSDGPRIEESAGGSGPSLRKNGSVVAKPDTESRTEWDRSINPRYHELTTQDVLTPHNGSVATWQRLGKAQKSASCTHGAEIGNKLHFMQRLIHAEHTSTQV